MNGLEQVAKLVIILGILTLIVGIILLFSARTEHSLFNLPGNLVIKKGNFTIYFPWLSMMVLSILLSIILNFLCRK